MNQSIPKKRKLADDESQSESNRTQIIDDEASTQSMDDVEENSLEPAYITAMLEKLCELQLQTAKEVRLLRLEVCNFTVGLFPIFNFVTT